MWGVGGVCVAEGSVGELVRVAEVFPVAMGLNAPKKSALVGCAVNRVRKEYFLCNALI